jgi:hypothetical protein
MVRISGLKRRSFWFTRIASSTPTVHCRVVASSVHTTVHCSTSRKVERQMERGENIDKVFQPHPVHQLRRRRVVQVVVGEGDGKPNRIGKITTNTSRIKPG